ncbi:NAD(P)/FAD-dependent oxidoreductase [Anaeromyxobacter diazotrophicus]|uniref:Sulfide:quinone reductase n=1 Tax=Anaeromyxobacter diazotrophicus TaxID=2590199 RepID=A0A7I9VJB1_9BACT|nr:FAD-dependent oxidoreductase [Anaeromyxobacter diazotrophicus]GEJ56506.1 sulfide:quinone reductase [Anaeromyxobacter diazotrophicus]
MSKHALVAGGGFAGLEAAIQLRRAGLDVTLVSNRPALCIYPISIWVATGERQLDDVCLDLADAARRHGFRFVVGEVEALSGARRSATVNGLELQADHLVVAVGGEKLRPRGVEHTFSLGGDPAGAQRLAAALSALMAKGRGRVAMGFGGNPKDPSAARGGPAFELMFNVDALLRRRGLRDRFELTFFAPMASPGERMGQKAVAAIQRMFGRVGVAMRFGKKIAGFEPGAVLFEDGARLASDLVVFLPAGEGAPVVKASDLPRSEAGFVETDPGCAVPGFPGVWAIGDAAALQGPEWRAKQGHLAEVMARVAARNIAAAEEGRAERESYLPHVGITCLLDMGHGAAYVHRDGRGERMIPLPVVGHWLKKGWGGYYKLSKKKLVPRLPGL